MDVDIASIATSGDIIHLTREEEEYDPLTYNEYDYVFRAKTWSNEEGFEQFNEKGKVLTVSPTGFTLKFQVCAKVSFRLGFLHGKDSTDRDGIVVKVGRNDGTWIATGVQAKDMKILASKATPDVNIVRKWYEDFWIKMENHNLCVGSGTRVGQATILCAHIPETAASAEQWTLGFGGSRHGRSTYFGIDNPVSMRQ